ncbi:nucleoside 2-deoxyribosyltransferase domain-containing protein [Streptomyces cinnamoneus]|uniref:nucleoside 2-deoxyribosyltransferase domain-containing protein n=1 Tax=Streptomyces cinnamoneus TaxID=53446 RepID=UPI0033FC0ECF
MRYVEAPENFSGPGLSLFLAGGITACPDWQQTAVEALADLEVTVLNPRRRAFPLHDPDAEAVQVGWEYRHLRRADHVLFWFPSSPSHQPIALYELGMVAGTPGACLTVGADRRYVRRANIVAQLSHALPDLRVHCTLPETIAACRSALGTPRS